MALFLVFPLLTTLGKVGSSNDRVYGSIDLTPLKGTIVYPTVNRSFPDAPKAQYTFAMSILSNGMKRHQNAFAIYYVHVSYFAIIDMRKRDNVTACEPSEDEFADGVMMVAWDDNGGCDTLGYYDSTKRPAYRYPDGVSPIFTFVHGNPYMAYNCLPSAVRRFVLTFHCQPNVELNVGILQTDQNFCDSRLAIETKYACPVQTPQPTIPNFTATPTTTATNDPSSAPTASPTGEPTASTLYPSTVPTRQPSLYPTSIPTVIPTAFDVYVQNTTDSEPNLDESESHSYFKVVAVLLSTCGTLLFI